ncbi:MAG: hypothetical protein LJE68_07510, partial [Rhodobacter sp.]|nr:hypothetical protein [Rhodobacter sp.]
MFHRICLILLIALAGVSLPLPRAVVAQEVVDTINYTDWQSVAERAEASVAAGLASDKAFESLRSEVV